MDKDQFIQKVREMRELQKRYFRERSGTILQQCKAAEKEVDSYFEPKKEDEHPKLFFK
jgi:hypothetical protein